MFRKLIAELFGTFWLVFAVLGTAMYAAGYPEVGVGFIGVAFAAGLAVLTGAYAVGGLSGAHFNPAVSLGLALAGRLEWKLLVPYWVAQIIGGGLAAAAVVLIASGKSDFVYGGFAANGTGLASPGGYSVMSGLVIEFILTGIFVIIILGATSKAAPVGFAPIAIGLALTVAHLIAIPVDNASLNPARSIASAIFSADARLDLWVFIVAPLAGAAAGGLIYRLLLAPGESLANLGRE